MLHKIIGLLIPVIGLLSCTKKDTATSPAPTPINHNWGGPLPAATQTGNGTFGCVVDGNSWIPHSGINPPLNWSRTNKRLTIHANDDYGVAFVFVCPPVTKDTTFTISNNTVHNLTQSFSLYYSVNSNTSHLLLPVRSYQGTFTFTRYDTVSSIYSGTFSMNMVDTVSGQTSQITQGRFDL